MDICRRIGKPSEHTARALKKLFPTCSTSGLGEKRRMVFDPSAECVAAAQQQKKKAANTRTKPRSITVVLFNEHRDYVPKGNTRMQLSKAGRIQKMQFRKRMSAQEVRNVLFSSFSKFDLKNMLYIKCGKDNSLSIHHKQDLNGDEIIELAGQGSLYIKQDAVEV